MTPEELAQRLGKTRTHHTGIMAQCPAHEDKEPSLNISEADGKLLLHCHSGCSQDDVIDALRSRDLWPRSKKTGRKSSKQKRTLIQTFDYEDENGNLRFSALKFDDPKRRFSYTRPDPENSSKKIWNLKGVTLIPFNLPEISKPGKAIFIVEGEKDVESLRGIGLVATTSPCGAGKWKPQYNKWFVDRDVIILPDNDQPGMSHATDIIHNLKDIAKALKLVVLPDLKPKGDVSDWLEGGGNMAKLRNIVRDTEFIRNEPTPTVAESAEPEPENLPAPLTGFIDFPHIKHNGKPISTIQNMEMILAAHGVVCRQNIIKKTDEILIKDMFFTSPSRSSGAMVEILNFCRQYHFPKDDFREFVSRICEKNAYNPVTKWIDSRHWDGKERFEDLLDTLDAKDKDAARPLLWRWLVSCVAAAFTPEGISARGVLVLQGAQHIGKTWWFKTLVGKLGELFHEGLLLDPQNKDSVKPAISSWICEIGELDATFRKADIAALKSFIGKTSDEIRLPYGREYKIFPRQTVLGGTVNEPIFLHDDTGNTRFWPIAVGDKLNSYHKIDMQQVWAQVKSAWESGESWVLNRKELIALEGGNQNFESISPFVELIMSKYPDMSVPYKYLKQATEVCIDLGYKAPGDKHVRQCGAALRKLFGAPIRSSKKTGWMLPEIH